LLRPWSMGLGFNYRTSLYTMGNESRVGEILMKVTKEFAPIKIEITSKDDLEAFISLLDAAEHLLIKDRVNMSQSVVYSMIRVLRRDLK